MFCLGSVAGSDGVFEINQACASGVGCFPGDNPGLPVEITQTGSYRLTSNLTVPDENTDGIEVQVDGVSIDLGGFAIIGPVTCDNSLNCTPAGSGHGINAGSAHQTGVSNGSIRGMGSFGLAGGFAAMVSNVRTSGNAVTGIAASVGSIIENSTARRNGGQGIFISNCVVRGCASSSNGGDGIGSSQSTITQNTVSQNKRIGISSGSSIIVNNAVILSGTVGISTGSGATVQGNTVGSSGGIGINAFGSTLVIGNTIADSTGYGLRMGSRTAFTQNVLSGNTGGHVVRVVNGATAVDLGHNSCEAGACVIDNP